VNIVKKPATGPHIVGSKTGEKIPESKEAQSDP